MEESQEFVEIGQCCVYAWIEGLGISWMDPADSLAQNYHGLLFLAVDVDVSEF